MRAVNPAYLAHYEQLAETDLHTPILERDYVAWQMTNLLSYMGSVRGKVVCDVGCGAGALTRALLRSGAKVTAVDLSATYLAALAGSGAKLACMNADDMNFDGEFDILVAADIMEHTFLYSVNRALKIGGELFVRVPYRENLLAYAPQWCEHEFVHLRSYNKPLLRDTLRHAGFRVDRFWLDGFSLGTPQPWFINSNRYNRWAEWLKASGYPVTKVTMWPSWFARLLMRPQEIVAKATKTREVSAP